jgi:glyoxylate carboligase
MPCFPRRSSCRRRSSPSSPSVAGGGIINADACDLLVAFAEITGEYKPKGATSAGLGWAETCLRAPVSAN